MQRGNSESRQIRAYVVSGLMIMDVTRCASQDAPSGLDWHYPAALGPYTIAFAFNDDGSNTVYALVEDSDESRAIFDAHGFDEVEEHTGSIPDVFGDNNGTVRIAEINDGWIVYSTIQHDINEAFRDRVG